MRFLLQLAFASALVLASQSCKNTAEISTPTDEDGLLKADVGEGKVIYMRDCTRCHEQKKIENFTSAQWANILPRMIIQASLNDTESRQVTAYVEWKLENN